MGKIGRDEAEVGMILSKPILNAQGALLINKGVELQESHLRLLKVWGISELFIENPEEDEEKKVAIEKLVSEKRAEIEFMFKGISTPMMTMIKKNALNQMRHDIEATF